MGWVNTCMHWGGGQQWDVDERVEIVKDSEGLTVIVIGWGVMTDGWRTWDGDGNQLISLVEHFSSTEQLPCFLISLSSLLTLSYPPTRYYRLVATVHHYRVMHVFAIIIASGSYTLPDLYCHTFLLVQEFYYCFRWSSCIWWSRC